ncbi:hypothetical protein [Nostoc sp.]|uniref:hypothetical protein n=1 Tax=Nostoc sp. TaxID=1180 RepID=UPI002FF6DCDB
MHNDVLTADAGADSFLYNTSAVFNRSAIGLDTISDFNSSQGDKIVLDKTTFSAFPLLLSETLHERVAVGIASNLVTILSNINAF